MKKREIILSYEEYESMSELSIEEQTLAERALLARENAYAPYSHFSVGAALITREGKTYVGCNQENVNFKGSCAERVALDSAATAGEKAHITTIAIAGGPLIDEKFSQQMHDPISPCGQCRQDLREVEDLGGRPLTVLLLSERKILRFQGIEDLLPFGVGPKDLGGRLLRGKS